MASLLKNLAEPYSSLKTYVPGDFFIRENELYRVLAEMTGEFNNSLCKKIYLADLFKGAKNSNIGGVYYLGSGTTFDIKTSFPNIDYTQLTEDNFLLGPASASVGTSEANTSIGQGWGGMYIAGAGSASCSTNISYDASTGVLNVGLSVSVNAYGRIDAYRATATGSITASVDVYLVLDETKNAINSNLGGVICLGTGTSFDIATLVPSVDYTQLTEANFIVHAVSNSMSGSYNSSDHSFSKNVGGSTKIVTSYDTTTGILTIRNTSLNIGDSVPTSGAWLNITSTITCQVYLIIGDILSV